MTDHSINETHIVGCSVTGPKHEKDNLPCEDAWNGEFLSGGRFVLAVGDGLGDASYASEGSKIATKEVTKALTEYLESDRDFDRETAKAAFEEAFVRTREKLTVEADKRELTPSDLGTTLLAVGGGPSAIAGAVVGDGGIVYENEESYSLLVPREEKILDLDAQHHTHTIQHEVWERSYRFGFEAGHDGVAVFSDGFENFAWNGLETTKESFFRKVFTLAKDISDPEAANEELKNAFEDPPFSTTSGDDKTIAIGVFPPASQTEVTDQAPRGVSTARALFKRLRTTDELKRSESFSGERVKTEAANQLAIGDIVASRKDHCVAQVEDTTNGFVKLYQPGVRHDEDLQDKIETMTNTSTDTLLHSAEGATFAWPMETIVSQDGNQFLGYNMCLGEFDDPVNILEIANHRGSTPQSTSSNFITSKLQSTPLFSESENKYKIPLQLAEAVHEIHKLGYAMGNLSHETVFVEDNDIVLSNCDSYHINDYSTTYSGRSTDPRYAPPEQPERGIEAVQRVDRFGLAVHIFQYLLSGVHPFEAEGKETVRSDYSAMIRENPFTYRDPVDGKYEPPIDIDRYTSLPAGIRRDFERCFVEGRSNPDLRPSAKDWIEILKTVA